MKDNIKLSLRINRKTLSIFGLFATAVGWVAIYAFIAFSDPKLTSTQVLIIMIDFFFE